MIKEEQQPFYVSPKVKITEVKPHSIICQSGGNESVKEVDYGDGGFEEEL